MTASVRNNPKKTSHQGVAQPNAAISLNLDEIIENQRKIGIKASSKSATFPACSLPLDGLTPQKITSQPLKITHYGAKSHADKFWVYLTQIQQIYPIGISNKLQVNRSGRTKAEAKLRLIARGERSVTPGMNNQPTIGIQKMRKCLPIKWFRFFQKLQPYNPTHIQQIYQIRSSNRFSPPQQHPLDKIIRSIW